MKKFLFHNRTLGVIDRLVAQSTGFLSLIFFSKILSPTEFGIYGLAYSIFLFLGLFESFFQTATIKFCATHNSDKLEEYISCLLFTKVFVIAIPALLIYFLANQISIFYHTPSLIHVFFWFPFLIIAFTIKSHFESVLKARLDLRSLLVQDLIFATTNIGLTFILWHSIKKAENVFAIILLSYVTSIAYLIIFHSQFFRIKRCFNKPVLMELIHYGKYTVLTGMGFLFYQNFDVILMGKFCSVESVGVYKIGRLSAIIVLVLSDGLLFTMMPKVSRLYELGKVKEIRDEYYRNVKIMLSVFIPFFIGSIFFSKLFFHLAFGNKYPGAAEIFSIFSFLGILRAFGNPQGALLGGVGLIKLDSIQMISSIAINVTFNFILIPRYGGVGAAISTLITILCGVILKEFFIREFYFKRFNIL